MAWPFVIEHFGYLRSLQLRAIFQPSTPNYQTVVGGRLLPKTALTTENTAKKYRHFWHLNQGNPALRGELRGDLFERLIAGPLARLELYVEFDEATQLTMAIGHSIALRKFHDRFDIQKLWR
jgi:hypothetical protein